MSVASTTRASNILDEIHEKCRTHLGPDDLVLCDRQVTSTEMDEYIRLIDDFVTEMPLGNFGDLLSSAPLVNMEDVMLSVGVTNEEFKDDSICDSRKCQINFLAKKRNALSFMTHILQDIVLFTNKIGIPGYYELFQKIEMREYRRTQVTKLKQSITQLREGKSVMSIRKLEGIILRLEMGKGTAEEKALGISGATATVANKNVRIGNTQTRLISAERDMSQLQDQIENMVERLRHSDFDSTQDDIISFLPIGDTERMKDIRMLLRKIIYLRKLENICRTEYNEHGGTIENASYRDHVDWIEMLENVFTVVNEDI